MIRITKNNDISTIYKLGKEYDKKFDKLYNIENYIDNSIYIVLVNEDNGFINAFIICTNMYETIEILLLYVDEKERNKGIGSNLILELDKYKYKKCLLEVSQKNISAYNLYLKMGFKVTGIREKYYNGINAIMMMKV